MIRTVYCAIFLLCVISRPIHAQPQPDPPHLNVASWPAGVGNLSELPKERAYKYEFQDIKTSQIENWLSYLGVQIPVNLTGLLSGWVWAQRSERGWFNFADYRVEGEITSPRLKVENWEFKNALLRFGFSNNIWYVGRLSGDIHSAGNIASMGRANLAAMLPLKESRLLQISGEISQPQLNPIFKAFDIDFEIENDSGSLNMAANVPFALMSNPDAWKSQVSIDLVGVRSQDIPQSNLATQINIANGEWQIRVGSLTIQDLAGTFSGSGALVRNLPYTVSIAGKNLSIAQLLHVAKLPELTSRLSGNVDVVAKVQGDLDRYLGAASGAVRSQALFIDGQAVQSVLLESVLDNRNAGQESLQLDLKSASVFGGTLLGKIGWTSLKSIKQLIPDKAELEVSSLELANLPASWVSIPLSGIANGRFEIDSRLDANKQLRQWGTDSRLTVDKLSVMKTAIGNTVLHLLKATDGEELRATVENGDQSLWAEAHIALVNSFEVGFEKSIRKYRAEGRVQRFNTTLLLGPNEKTFPLAATGKFELLGNPKNWLATGHAELSQMDVQVAEQAIAVSDVIVNIREDAFRLERFRINDSAAGRVAGSALVHRGDQGEHLLNLRIAELEIEPYLNDFLPSEYYGLGGMIGFESRLRKTASNTDLLNGWTGVFDADLSTAEYRGTPIGRVAFHGDVDADQVKVTGDGRVLGGELNVSGIFSLEDEVLRAKQANAPISLTLRGVELNRLMSLFYGPRMGDRYSGTANLEIASSNEFEGLQIRLGIPSFHYQLQELAKELTAGMIYQDGFLTVKEIDGRLADGRVNILGEVQMLHGEPTGELRFSADRLNIRSLATILAPDFADHYSGIVTYRGNVQIGKEIVFIGNSQVENSVVYELPIQDLRNDLFIKLSMNGELKEVSARKIYGTAIGGRVDGEAHLRGGRRFSFDVDGKVSDGRLDQLSRALGFDNIVGTGRFDANAKLKSSDATDIAALTGPLQLNFTNGDVKSFPVLSEIGRFVPVLQLASTGIKNGTMHGQFGQGQLNVPDLFLNSDAFYLIANGSTSLKSGRLDFEALLQTGGSIEDQVQQSAAQRLIALAFPELMLLTEINDLVRNRTVFLHVGGTSKHPAIQPKAAQTVARALIQNLRRKLVAIQTPSAAAAAQNNN